MKFFKVKTIEGNDSFCKGDIIPLEGVEISEEEYQAFLIDYNAKEDVIRKAIADYVQKVKAGEMTLEEVPQEYRAEVEAIVNAEEPEEDATEEDYLNALAELGVTVNE